MSKKMKMIPSIFKANNNEKQQQWQWPSSCRHPRTLSFRSSNNKKSNTPKDDEVFKTVNSVFLDTPETPESWFTNSSDCASTFSDDRSDDPSAAADAVEMIIRGVRSSERLFFEPGGATSSILKDAAAVTAAAAEEAVPPFEAESVAVAMESDDPYTDFKKSMWEMVESHGLKDWDCLEELLGWYLKKNGKQNHGFIVAAFVDLLVGLGDDGRRNSRDECDSSVSSTVAVCSEEESAAAATTTTSYSSAGSCFSSPVAADDDEQSDIVVQS